MDFAVVLEVAIGLIVVWLVLSLTVIQIQEWIAGILKLRANDLEKAIGQMLANPELAKEFYKHPLIKGLSKRPGTKPDYIPPREFTLALFNVITTAGTEASIIRQAASKIKNKDIGELLRGFKNIIKRSQAQKDLEALLKKADDVAKQAATVPVIDSLKSDIEKLKATYPVLDQVLCDFEDTVKTYQKQIGSLVKANPLELTDTQLQNGISAITKLNPELARTMSSLLGGIDKIAGKTEDALVVARTNIESWFNNSMDRLTGVYKSRSQIIAFVIGICLAAALNVNSITIAQALWLDPTMRAAMLEYSKTIQPPPAQPASAEGAGQQSSAQTKALPPAEAMRAFQEQLDSIKLPMGWVAAEVPASSTCAFYLWPGEANQVQGIPSGANCYRPIASADPKTGDWFWFSLLGMVISAAAVTQGAPFWFDMFNKLINLRVAGAKPQADASTAKPTSQTPR